MTPPIDKPALHLITSPAEFFGLAPDWNAFLQRTRSDSVFLTWEYLSAWWEVYGKDFELRIITARDASGALLGIAPLMVGRGHAFPRRHFRHLTMLGGLGDSLAEYQDFLILPGWEAQLIPAFLNFIEDDLADDWEVMLIRDADERSPNLAPLLGSLAARGNHAVIIGSRPAPNIQLPDTWESFLAGKSKNFKKQFNNHWNRLHKSHRIQWLEAGNDLSVAAAMNIVANLNRLRWGQRGDSFRSPEFTRFHEILAERFHERGWLFLRILRVDGEDAAARYDYVYQDKLWNFQNGWRPDLEKLSLGKLLIGYSVKYCIDQGLREYDFLGGTSEYKTSWATGARNLLRFEIANPRKRSGYMLHQLHLLRSVFRNPLPKRAA